MSDCVLFHFAFDPGSRAVRLALGEARIAFSETPSVRGRTAVQSRP